MNMNSNALELTGKTIVITAGPTYEDLDPVRFLGNRSSGKMGFALAEVAADVGAKVYLIAGPCQQETPKNVHRIDVRSAEQMFTAVMEKVGKADLFIGCAAVADYRPAECQSKKIKKNGDDLVLHLIQNPDILASVAALNKRPFTVGFAAETNNVADFARGKLARKKLDMIAANQVGEDIGFDCCDNALLVLYADGRDHQLPIQDKHSLSKQLLSLISMELYAKH